MPRTNAGFPTAPTPSGALTLLGPTIYVDIGFDPAYKPQGATAPPTPGIRQVWALVDTGASECCIDSELAATLGLPVVDQRQIGGAGGATTVSYFLAQMHIPALSFTMWGELAGVHLAGGGQRHQALVGRTFLQRFTMAYDGRTGEVTIAGPDLNV